MGMLCPCIPDVMFSFDKAELSFVSPVPLFLSRIQNDQGCCKYPYKWMIAQMGELLTASGGTIYAFVTSVGHVFG